MAIYHLHCDIIGRSGGRSATAAAAYRATSKIEDRTTGETFDFSRKEKAIFSMILTNKDVPEWAKDRAELWNSCEEKENRKNSQFCRSFDIALMKELSWEENAKLVVKWWYENYGNRGLVGDLAIHQPHKNRDGTTNENLHAHILIPTRKMNKDGWTEKDREGNDREFLERVRKSWADIVNAKFKELGMSERIDERTLEEQGIDREPQRHQGVTATAMERKGNTVRRKKYKSQEEKQIEQEIKVEEIIVNSALHSDPEYIKLKVQRDEIVRLQNSPEHKALKKVEWAIDNILSNTETPKQIRDGVKSFVQVNQREEYFYYIKQNTQEELNYWESKKSKDWHDEAYNKALDEDKKTVREIAKYPQFDKIIYPKVDKLYDKAFNGFALDMGGKHKSKFTKWVETTDFLPVKICRLAIQKIRQWRDENYPRQIQSQSKGWGRDR